MKYSNESKLVNQIEPLVSVCVPTFQHVKYIQECLDSILSQKTNFPYEILIGEDDSTDGTREICQNYAAANPNKIRLFLRCAEDKMVRNGRKTGRLNHLALYRSARGKYVCICDGDDFWVDSQKLQIQFDLLERYPNASLCITDTFIDGDPLVRPSGLPHEFCIYTPDQLNKKNYFGHISSWMMRNAMNELLENEVVMKANILDMVLFTFYKIRGNTIFVPKVTSVYNLNPNGVYRSRSSIQNHKTMIKMNWYLFYYLHKNPFQFIRTVGHSVKRYYINFIRPAKGIRV